MTHEWHKWLTKGKWNLYFHWTAVFILLSPSLAFSQNFRFSTLSIGQGLSQSNISALAQDSIGFLWIGTIDGLNRYDGRTIKTYTGKSDEPGSLSSSSILSLYVDHTGILWVGTEKGLNRYNSENDVFESFCHLESDSTGLSSNIITSLFDNGNGILWIGTKAGLNCMDLKTGKISAFHLYPGTARSRSSDQINGITAMPGTSDKELILATGNGLYLYRIPNRKFERLNASNDSLNGPFTCVLSENDENIWAGTWGKGLIYYNRKNGRMQRTPSVESKTNSESEKIVLSLCRDQDGKIWAGTRGAGILVVDPATRMYQYISHQPDNVNGISDNTVQCCRMTRDRQLWFGTRYGGLNKFNPAQKNFRNISSSPATYPIISGNLVSSVLADRRGILWIGTTGAGLNRIQSGMKSVSVYKASGESLSNNDISCILEDQNGKYLWIATDGGGLNQFNPITGSWKTYRHNRLKSGTISNDYIYSLAQDPSGGIWIGTWGNSRAGGLDYFNPVTEKFINYIHKDKDSNTLAANIVLKNFIDSRGNLWIGTKGEGLYRCTPDSSYRAKGYAGRLTHFAHQENNPHSLSHNDVYDIYEDAAGNIWVGTFSGLNRFEPEIGGFSRYTKNNGLPDNMINSILDDRNGNLWVSTAMGLACIASSGDVKVYHKEDGLQDEVFLPRSSCRSQSGVLFFGGVNGFTSFDPDSINITHSGSRMVITDIRIYDNDLKEQKRTSFYYPGHWNSNHGNVHMIPSNFMISIEFASIDFDGAQEKRYQYKLEGFSDDWIETSGTEHRAVFTNLDPGTYTFRAGVTGTMPGSGEETTIRIIVEPPFYKTLLFKILVSLSLAFLLAVLFIRRLERLQKEKLQIEQQARESLFEERNQLRTLIDHIPDVIFIKDRNSRFIVANRELARVMGNRKPEDLIGETDHIYYSPEVANAIFNEEQELMRNGIPQINHIVPRFDRQGKKSFISLTRVPLKNSAGEVVGLVGISRDVTQLKKTEEKLIDQTGQLQEMNTILMERQEEIRQQSERLQLQSENLLSTNEKLEHLNATKDKLFSIIAHDLKNPFHAIIGFTNLMSVNFQDLAESEKRELIDLINTSAENAFALLENLLSWARTQTDTIKFSPGPLNLREILDNNVRFIESSARRKNIAVAHHLKLDIIVYADKNMLDTILRNLMNNAVKFTPDKGKVDIYCEIIKGYAEIRVSDTGVGMTPESLKTIFRIESYQSTRGTSGETGTGLGLIVSREFVEKHGGTLRAESIPGQGSTFIFTLPLEVDG